MMNRIGRILLLSLLAAAALPAALQAQPFRSDVPGIPPTGSGLAGAGYPVIPIRELEGALFRQVNGAVAFRSQAIATAVQAEGAAAYAQVCADSLHPPRDWADSIPLPVREQRLLCGLLTEPELDSEWAQRTLRVLRACVPGHPDDPAAALVAALAGLATADRRFVDDGQRFVAGARWQAAFLAYERFLDAAPDAALAPPPPELVVIAAFLDRMVDAGLAAAPR